MTYLDSMKDPIEKAIGVGTGTQTAVTSPAIGTGGGPANPQAAVQFVPYMVAGVKYWIPLFQ
jgi:hypothetical protein